MTPTPIAAVLLRNVALPLSRLLPLGLCLLPALPLRGGAVPSPDEGRLLSQAFLPEDYRGDIQISAVTQTRDGLIYAAALGAIKEYDGRVWRSIATPTAWVLALETSPDGRVWYAANDDIGVLEPGPDGRRRCRSLLDQVPAAAKPLGQAWFCKVRPDGVYWSASTCVLRWRDGAMRVWTFPEGSDLTLLDSGKALYLAVKDDALYRLDGETWTPLSRDARVARYLLGLFDGWAGKGLMGVDGRGAGWTIAEDGTVSEALPALAPEDVGVAVSHAIVLRDGRLALATKGRGLLIRAADGRVDQRFGLDGGTSSVSMLSLYQDREDGLWIGSKFGVTRVDLDRGITVHDERTGAPSNIGLGSVRHGGVFYVGAEDGVYRHVPAADARRGKFERVPGPAFFAYTIFGHRSGLVAAGDRGLYRVVDGAFVPDCPLPENVYGLGETREDPDRIFAVGAESVRTLHWDGSAWRDEGTVADFHSDVTSLAEDRDGNLWGGTSSRGLFRLRRQPGRPDWQSAQCEFYGTERGLPEGHEWVSVYDTPLGPLFAHARGVSVYDAATDRIVPSPAFAAVGRASRYAFPLASRPDGTIWAQLGNPAKGEPLEIGGLVPTPGGGWRWRPLPARVAATLGYLGANALDWEPGAGGEGVLWAMGQKRFLRIDLDAELRQPPPGPPATLLREARRGVDELPVLAGGPPPVLGFSRDELGFRFASATFAAGGKLEFQHRLLGYDEAWSGWTERDEAGFGNLPAGDYVFEVRARRAGGEPGAAARWAFAVTPPWWRGALAMAGYLVLVLGALWAFVRWRLGRLERERRRLEGLVRERTGELARERDRADAANRAKTAFLANMSHELRTPLHAILGYSQMLGADPTLPERARERLQIVGSSGRHLLRLINEVLDLSKIEAGRLEVNVAPFDLPALLGSIAAAHEPRAAAKGLAFRRSDPAGLPANAAGDSAKLRQVLENLLGNAIKFTACGEVRLLALPIGAGRVRFEVSDTGPGIAAADLARIFQPFTQLPNGGAPAEGGTGLGLAIAQRLVALLGGRLEVASAVGQGSRFWFELELAGAGVPVRGPGPEPSCRKVGYDGPRRRVLAVDDVEANRRLFTDLLAPLGFEVVEAGSAAETMARLGSFRPDLVLLDLRLPDSDGFALARRLRADPRLEGVKILAASASVFNQDPAAALAAGCDGFIAKPFLPEEFFTRIGELLALTWRETVETPAAMAEPLDPALLGALRTAAAAGDIVAVREAFGRLRERHPQSAALGPLARAIENFDTDGLVRLASPAAGPSQKS